MLRALLLALAVALAAPSVVDAFPRWGKPCIGVGCGTGGGGGASLCSEGGIGSSCAVRGSDDRLSVNGIVGTVGNEETWQALLAQTRPAFIPDDFRWAYVDPIGGDDGNLCGPSDPCKSAEKIAELLALPKMAVAVNVGTIAGETLGEGITVIPNCSSDPDDSGMFCSYAVARQRIGETSTWLPTSDFVRLDATQEGDDLSGGDAVIKIGNESVLDQYGTVVFEGFEIITDELDGYSQKGSARLRLIRSRASSTANGSSDQCFTTHEVGSMFGSNIECHKTNGNSAAKPVGSSKMTLLGNGTLKFTESAGQTRNLFEYRNSTRTLIGGLTLHCDDQHATGTSAVIAPEQSSALTNASVTIVRSVLRGCDDPSGGNDGYGVWFRGGADRVYDVKLLQTTIFGADRAIFTQATDSLSGSSAFTFTALGLLIEPVQNLVFWLNAGWATDTAVTATIDHFIFDDDDAANPFKIDSAAQTEFAAFNASATRWTFTNTGEEGATNDSQYVDGTAICSPARDCNAGLEQPIVFDLPECLEAWDMGAKLCSFALDGRNVGAR